MTTPTWFIKRPNGPNDYQGTLSYALSTAAQYPEDDPVVYARDGISGEELFRAPASLARAMRDARLLDYHGKNIGN